MYVGVNLGYQWGRVTNSATRPDGFTGGLGLGFNWQYGQLVYGVETDIQLSGADDTVAGIKFSNPYYGTLRGRGGFVLSTLLWRYPEPPAKNCRQPMAMTLSGLFSFAM